jgi:hypothetical protein
MGVEGCGGPVSEDSFILQIAPEQIYLLAGERQ